MKKLERKPVIAVTIGDPAGIGPEIVLDSLTSKEIYDRSIPIVIGSVNLLRRCAKEVGIEGIVINPINEPSEACGTVGQVDVIDVPVDGMDELKPGLVQVEGGLASDAYIRKACALALEGKIDAISTAPINKESLRAAGIEGIGHTEMLAQYLDADNPLTLFVTENMRIFFLSRHFSLRKAIDYITEDRVYEMIGRVNSVMQNFGFPNPKIAVAALNPHASDGGQFGNEEEQILIPAIQKSADDGINVTGPVGADSVFNQALEGRFDCVISLYHDQGHIAAKTRDFFRTVTATLGLPILRTSVDHGTGFDIAWKGKASSVSMEAAILATCDFLSRMKK